MTRIGSQIEWITLEELVLAAPGEDGRTVRMTHSGPDGGDLFPRVIVTMDRRVIAGWAYLRSCGLSPQDEIPCRVVDAGTLDVTLTAIHHRLLYGPATGREFDLLLELYADLCFYRHHHGGAARESRG